MVNRRDYSAELVDAARSVLLEIMRVLGEYQDEIVVVGDRIPELLLHQVLVKRVPYELICLDVQVHCTSKVRCT